MDVLKKSRLLVCARGVEAWVRTLSDRADSGDREASAVLDKMREAFETAHKLLDYGPELQADEYVAIYDGLLILEAAAQGRSEYPIDVLRSIAEQVQKDLQRLGREPLDTSFLYEEPNT
ncbi:MAG TPA: hypothetical protein VFZ27_14595 [Terriglobia bacterium]|nr:hypothetical protein [Terriglobia bacterium]